MRQRGGIGAIAAVDHQDVEERAIACGDPQRGDGETESPEQPSKRAPDGAVADERRDRRDRTRARRQGATDTRHRENGADAQERIAGCQNHRVGSGDGGEYAGSRARARSALVGQAAHFRLGAPRHEVALERQRAFVGMEQSADAIVRHGEDTRGDVERPADLGGDGRKRRATSEPVGSVEMRREIAVPKMKPAGVVEAAQGGEASEGVVPQPPAAGTRHAGKRVGDGIEIRGDRETKKALIVRGIDDERECRWVSNPDQAAQESRGPDSAR